MDLIADYSDEGTSGGTSPSGTVALPAIDAAPTVDTTGLALVDNKAVALGDAQFLQSATARSIKYNLPAAQLYAPIAGPANPSDRGGMSAAQRNHWAGRAEDAHLSSYAFDDQYHTFANTGRAADPGLSGKEVAPHAGVSGYDNLEGGAASKRQRTGDAAADKKKQQKAASQPAFDPSAPFTLRSRQPWAEKEAETVQLTEEQAQQAAAIAEEKAEKSAAEGRGEHTTFHGIAERDYQGRSWLEVPSGARQEAEASFLPKRHLHTWSGHTKGVNAIRFFPETGHLLLSAGLDGKVKVWNVHGDRKCMRTYVGHSKGVRDAWFTSDGRRFITAAYDKTIKVWDTETGAVLSRLGDSQQMAYCVRTHPDPGQSDVLLAGMQSRKILQFDMRTTDVVQEYDYHLAAINTLNFVDNTRRFISTSDDKTIRVWEFGIPVQVKYIADPTMHAISAAAVSNSGKFWVGQSADNQVLTYTGDDRTRPVRKKTFRGHTSAGYACQLGFSPDDKYLMSGDGDGKLFVWDWKSSKVARTINAHDGVCIGVAWHPLEASRVATCGWDGAVKLWD